MKTIDLSLPAQKLADNLNSELRNASVTEALTLFLRKFKGKVALASSLSIEDQVLTKIICDIDKEARIFTLDTGRLFPDTYDLIHRTNKKYDININVYFPDAEEVEKMVNAKGINLFYESIENRELCCKIRKIGPLKRAFAGLKVWVCGLRREQSVTRQDVQMVEWDRINGLIKFNPIIDWTERQVQEYLDRHKIPYNYLHDRGYPSIGCQPCTRAITDGEEPRAGRWWWEKPENKECGLHK